MQHRQDRDQTSAIEKSEGAQHQDGEEQALTIQQMVRISGLSAHTLRYYERARLMPPVERDDTNGYRTYTSDSLDWIEFIKRLRATSMPIRDIQRYTQLLLQGEQTTPERLHLLKQHQKQVKAHLLEVEKNLAAITAKIAYYEQEPDQRHTMTCEVSTALQDEE
ncbi:hypothetical protein KSC_021840 [Ktedonobacter sp. SOSP1-52]|uniref:MerR family transcriptional regulator n=1 Tax=Ktedonobacter sp. SOSP1-52 TaxID=2778366 RepID=UPI0019166163|nr:MerR family transcriptional regulator [Ktedonobacter sp. SOSP1-52]GHO63292.1 hypothetical protein KSC_021840 [Ktedonobacter sp. SOSP1-52]